MITTQNIWLSALILITTGLGMQGCTTPEPVKIMQQALPLPARPVLPSISSTDLTSVSDDVYERLATRNRLLRQYAEQLEVIIKSTHQIRDSPDD
ncbi:MULTISPECIES: hypothetical protein [Methylobacter]